MRFASLILKNLTRRPARTGLTLLALTMAVASVVALRGIAKGFTDSFAAVYESHAVDVVVSRQGTADRLSSSVEASAIEQIRSVAGVANVDGVLMETLSLEDQQVFGIPTMGIAEKSWMRRDFQWQRIPSAQPLPERRVSLGVNLADRVKVKPGDEVMLFEDPYLVVGIFESPSAWENGSMIMPLSQLQEITGRPGQVTYINVMLEDQVGTEGAERILADIQQQDPRLHAMTTGEFVETDTRMQIASAMAWMTSLIALVIGAIGTLNTMMTSVLERTREIGVLRAVGWTRRRVITMVLSESVLLAVIASGLGAVLAVVATSAMSQHPAVRGILSPVINTTGVVEGAVLAVLIGLFGAIIPARRAATILPTEALRAS